MKRLFAFLAITLAACGPAEPTVYDQVYEDFPGAREWYDVDDIDAHAELACELIATTGGEGSEWRAQIAGLWNGTPHQRQADVFGDDPAQIVTYFRILSDHECPIGG